MTNDLTQSYSAALVTGGTRRLGRAMALALAKRGLDVAVKMIKAREDDAASLESFRAEAEALIASVGLAEEGR